MLQRAWPCCRLDKLAPACFGILWEAPELGLNSFPTPCHCSPFGNSVAGNSEDACLGITHGGSCKLKGRRGGQELFFSVLVFSQRTLRPHSRTTAAETGSSQGPTTLQSSVHFPLCSEAWPRPPCSLPTPSPSSSMLPALLH